MVRGPRGGRSPDRGGDQNTGAAWATGECGEHSRLVPSVRVRAGFSLLELLVALTLASLVLSAVVSVLVGVIRGYGREVARIEASQTLREVLAVLLSELRELDPAGGDLLTLSDTSVTYLGARNIYFLCRPPAADERGVSLTAATWVGLQPLDPETQLFRLYAPGSPFTSDDDAWLPATGAGGVGPAVCPGGPGLWLPLDGPSPDAWSRVPDGAPLRGYRVTRLESYRDAEGVAWLGAQTRDGWSGAWNGRQPITGPLTEHGLEFTYFAADGRRTSRPDSVARILVSVTVRAARAPVTAHLSTNVAPRNRPVP